MQQFRAEPPFKVIERDRAAHIALDSATGQWGCAFFVPHELDPTHTGGLLPILAVTRPCLVMGDTIRDGQLHLSVADPDLRLENGVSRARPVRIVLRGPWRILQTTGTLCAWPLPDAAQHARVSTATAAATTIEVLCRHGASYDLCLGHP